MESVIIRTLCKGCGKVQNGTEFKACPICMELKMLPSMYCCEECFRADWKTHKKKHDEFSKTKTQYLENSPFQPASKEHRKDLKRASEAKKMTYEYARDSILIAMTDLDYNKAEILCRKAISRFPSYPEPYYHLAQISSFQGEDSTAMHFLEASIEKTCRILLTTATKKTSNTDEFFLSHYVQRGLFLKIMYVVFYYMERNRIFNDKRLISLWNYYSEIIKDKNSFSCDQVLWQGLLDPETISSLLESRRNHTNPEVNTNQTSSPYFDGEWVIAHGLTSSVGKTLNHRVAMVKGDDLNEEGRVAVVFEEEGPIKYLKVENLKYARTVNIKASLLLFLDESEQWKFMVNDFFAV